MIGAISRVSLISIKVCLCLGREIAFVIRKVVNNEVMMSSEGTEKANKKTPSITNFLSV
jgi:hypothetical protein